MKKIAALIICGLLLCSIVFAQAPNLKIGYINSATLLNAMPEKAKADSDLAAYAKSFQFVCLKKQWLRESNFITKSQSHVQ